MTSMGVRYIVDKVSLRATHASVTCIVEMPPTGDARMHPQQRFTVAPPERGLDYKPGTVLLFSVEVDPNQILNSNRDAAWQQYSEQAQAAQSQAMQSHPLTQIFAAGQQSAQEHRLPGLAETGETSGDRAAARDREADRLTDLRGQTNPPDGERFAQECRDATAEIDAEKREDPFGLREGPSED